MGTDLLFFYKDKVKKQWKIAFWAAFAACLLIHIYKFTNPILNHDSVFNVYTDQNMTASGRWLLQYACGISSYFDLHWVNGLLCAMYLGLTTAIVTELFDLKNPVVIALCGAFLAGTPSTTETLFFGFTADGYLLGITLCALAALLSCKGRGLLRNVLSGTCICAVCAIYQAYISFAGVLCVCWMVNQLLENKMTVKDAWKWIGRHLAIYALALAAYYAIWKGIMAVTGIQANDYQGISTAGQISIGTIIGGAVKSVTNLFFFFLEWNILEHPVTLYAALNIVFLIALAAVVCIALVKSGCIRQPGKLVTILFALAATVPMISLLCFISDGVDYRPMMLHSVAVLYLFAVMLFDRWTAPKLSTAFGLLIAVMIFNFAVMANVGYSALDACYEKSYYMGSRMMERIEQLREEEEIHSIHIVGNLKAEAIIDDTLPYSRVHLMTTLIEDHLLYDPEHVYPFLRNTFDLELPLPEADVRRALENSDAVADMGVWPADNSVQVVDGVLVIKLDEITV